MLTIVASLAGLVAPAAWSALEAARFRAAQRSLSTLLETLPLAAWRSGLPLQRDAPQLQADLIDWPSDWSLSVSSPLRYAPNGVAQGGTVQILAGRRVIGTVVVEPITGRPSSGPIR